MKRILLFGMTLALVAITFTSCSKTPANQCRIHGTTPSQYNDKRIFLVPLYGPKTAEYVDSIEIKDGKFEFTTDTLMMAQILVDYHYRMGVQPLLVVTEPGDVQVIIDTMSHATGTPQNDSLEKWKQATEAHNLLLAQLRRDGKDAASDSMHLAYKQLTRRMAENCKGTLVGDFLATFYPLTYKRKMPDGSIVTFDADTNEEIPE